MLVTPFVAHHAHGLDWQQDAASIVHKIQAFNSWPVAYTAYRKGQLLRLWQAKLIAAEKNNSAQCGEVVAESPQGIDIMARQGIVRVLELQMPGKKRILVRDFINGQSLSGFQF